MLLSIVMMIKNEERFLEETLKSLMPLINDIDSELIILDTGSNDNSLDIAKKYTDKVYFSKWNNNFADMRNKSISYAKGEWILILDADEKLTSYEKIKEFFKSDLYKKYNSASISLKNIMSEDEKLYTYVSIMRLFKRDKNLKYIGAIHEQPIFKEPTYNNIAEFDHYGYLYIDEELRQRKSKRNKQLLFNELKKDPNNPYINYQLAKEFTISDNFEEAFYYVKKSYNLYVKYKNIPIFVIVELINLNNLLGKYNESEKLCNKYIKEDDKNIDIYFYLYRAQLALNKYEEAIKSLKRYKYLIDNYDISTQATRIDCQGLTLSMVKGYYALIIEIYYKLEKYNEIIQMIEFIEEDTLENLYYIIINSLYKTNNSKKILELYKKLNTDVQKNKFKVYLELFLNNVRSDDKKFVYQLLSNIEGNYGLLNKLRLNNSISIDLCSEILNTENEVYYGELLYYVLDNYDEFITILSNLDYLKIYNYLIYLIKNKKESIFKLYDILINKIMSLSLNSIKINATISKVLLFNGGLIGEKYKNVFYIYLTYQYERIRYYYNKDISDYEILDVVNDEESKFILKFNIIKKLKEDNKLKYIKELKKLLIENQCYKKGLEFIIGDFKREFNENNELKELKKKFMSVIEEKLNNGEYEICRGLIKQYEEIHGEYDLYNIKIVLNICEGNVYELDKLFKLAYCNNKNNKDLLFNIAYIKENQGDIEEAIIFYRKLLDLGKDNDIIEKIEDLNSKLSNNFNIKKSDCKKNIERLINNNKLEEARELLEEYKKNYKEDISIYSMEGIILLNEGKLELACDTFINGLELDNTNVDLLYNMAYSSLTLGYVKEAIYYYNRCLGFTEDNELKNEIKNILKKIKNETNKKTIITIGLNNDKLLENITGKFINININENIEQINQYYDKEVIVYESSFNNVEYVIAEITKDINNNYLIIFNDYRLLKNIKKKENYKFIYYINNNLSNTKKDYLNQNINIYFEKEACDKVDFIFTNNIISYYFKTLIEKRKNVYFINEELDLYKQISFNNETIEELSFTNISSNQHNITNEYLKEFYYLILVKYDSDRYIENIKNIYEKYNTEEGYNLYISALIDSKRYDDIIAVTINSDYCEDIYKSEVYYLNSIEEYDLIEFIIYISIKNYRYVDFTNGDNLDYKQALYFYELNQFDKSYEKYKSIINQSKVLRESPLVNRNTSFLMNKNNDYNYEEYYNKYKNSILNIKEKNKEK